MGKRLVAALAIMLLSLGACSEADREKLDPYHCGPDDVDGDGDGRCNE